MPPALSKAIRAGAVAKGRKAVPIVAGEDGKQTEKLLKSQTEKAEGMIDKFETAQRATLVGLDKKFFKEVKQLTEKIEGRLVLATPSARTQASQAIKYLDHIVKLVKAYKALVIRSSSSRQS